MEAAWFFRLRFRRALNFAYDSDFRILHGLKGSYDSDYDSDYDYDTVASKNRSKKLTHWYKKNTRKLYTYLPLI